LLERDVHLNLVDSTRQLFEFDSGAVVEAEAGWLFGAGRAENPVTSNIAFRIDDDVDPAELIANARRFFGERRRGFALWARGGVEEDRELLEAAESAGFKAVYEMPEMVLRGQPLARLAADGLEIRRVTGAAEAADYWRVAQRSYATLGFPAEVFAYYDREQGFLEGNVAAFVASADGRPGGIAMTVVSNGIAGVYWVGTTEEARGRGLAWAATAAAVEAGLELGPDVASLQASHLGEGLYRRMGFEAIHSYRLLAAPAA
jgi:ribosomal protein S18 acetylase RimI-like enzyme